MKNKRVIIAILLSIIIVLFFFIVSVCEGDENYPVSREEDEISMEDFSQVCIAPGENETMLNFSWYSKSLKDRGQIRVWDKSGIIRVYNGKSKEMENGFVSNKVIVTNLKENTTYYYSYKRDGIWSKEIKYKTKNFKNFTFVFMADPQIGASAKKSCCPEEGIKIDFFNWNKVIRNSLEKCNNLSFIICGGDETNTKEDKNNFTISISNLEYSAFLKPCYLRYIPIANTIGNHDKDNENFYNHFYMPNVSSLGETIAGSDYYFTYGNAIFLFLNSNNLNINEHEKFIETALKQNKNSKWKIAILHHNIYGCGIHSSDNNIKKLRDALPSILEKNNIDLVLSGHDHIYSRTYQLKNNEIIKDSFMKNINGSDRKIEIIKNPKGITFITGGSSTGSKFYKSNNKKKNYIKSKYDKDNPTYTMIKVTENNIVIETYRVNNDDIIDNKIIIEK